LTRRRDKGCNSALFGRRKVGDETHLSTLEDAAQAHARFPGAEAHARRTRRPACPPREGAGTAERLRPAGPAALPRSARLLRRAEFSDALASGPSAERRHFTIFVKPNERADARLGIIAGKRVAARAVDRNRVKRLVREAFRGVRRRLGGVDIVVLLRRCPARRSNAAASAEITQLLQAVARRRADA
jgi:ribonuclease P protein component